MKYIYPTLLKSANYKTTISCFDFYIRKNKKYRKRKKRDDTVIKSTYTDTYKIRLYPDTKQKEILKLWLDDSTTVYNIANNYIKTNVNDTNIRNIINFYSLRKTLNSQISEVCKINKLNKHTADYAVKHCVEMYKSALSNHKFLDKFNITDLSPKRRRKNLVIEPGSVSTKTNAIFIKQLNEIKSSSPLNLIKRNSILQYDTIKNDFFIIIPMDITVDTETSQYEKVGIDIGVRTFLTTYSEGESLEIAPNNNKIIDKYNKKKDSIKSNFDNKKLSKNKYNNAFIKYSDKLKNRIDDLHNKACSLLLGCYKEIIIGKVSIKKMISNLTGNLQAITKRRLVALSHYKFREKLKRNAFKYGCKITEVTEYLTSKTCSNCNVINDALGSSKIFNCSSCSLCIDRDINASINIYKNEILSR